jgi:hypothetical protein
MARFCVPHIYWTAYWYSFLGACHYSMRLVLTLGITMQMDSSHLPRLTPRQLTESTGAFSFSSYSPCTLGSRDDLFSYIGYTGIFNLLDYPSCVFPVTAVDPKLDVVDKSYKPANSLDKENWLKCKRPQFLPRTRMEKSEAPPNILVDESPDKYARAPVSLQVSGRRFHEEEVLGLAGVISKAL